MHPSKRKLIYVISDFMDRAIPFEWIAESSLSRDFELSFALMNKSHVSSAQSHLEATGCPVHFIPFKNKRDLPTATLRLAELFRRLRPHAVHTHLTSANLGGLTAANAAFVHKRIYTRHHTTLHHDYYKHAVIYDRTANRLATDIIATCENGRQTLLERESVRDSKIRVINLGFKLDHFAHVPEERVNVLRDKYSIKKTRPVIGVVSKYLELKGIQYVIPAFKEVLKVHPDALLILANARPSPFKATVHELLKEIPRDSYVEIEFEEDAAALFKLFNVFVHVPVDPQVEAFGQVYIEALASGIPSIFTLSGIAREFARDGENCLTVPFRNSSEITTQILRLFEDKALARRLGAAGYQAVRERFGFELMVSKLTELYLS